MSAHVLSLFQTSWGKRDEKEIKCKACRAVYLFFTTSSINSIIQASITVTLKSHFSRKNVIFCHCYIPNVMDVITFPKNG